MVMDEYLKNGARILVIKLSAMGDVVHTFPVVAAVKKARPDISLDWVVAEGYRELVGLSRHVDNVILFKRKEWGSFWKPGVLSQISGFLRNVREKEYDAVVDLQGLLRSGLITAAARSPLKIGFDYAREGATLFYNRKIGRPPGQVHAIERYLGALKEIGIPFQGGPDYGISVPQRETLWAETVTPKEPFAVVNPNARWKTKRWSAEKFAGLVKELEKRHGMRSVIIGGPDDVKTGAQLASMAGPAAMDLTGKGGFAHLAALLGRAAVMFTNDSGPMHLAVALNIPVVAVFGPTNPNLTGPYGPGNMVVAASVDCSPCYKRECEKGMECMDSISVESVLTAWNATAKAGARR
ncbi:MAG: lipopolysaccharide heptosyltransferase I [Nitrospinae bacterium]|nr:lipopolysaccharide heptosyltransferase I [Nitrospinota bacterium]